MVQGSVLLRTNSPFLPIFRGLSSPSSSSKESLASLLLTAKELLLRFNCHVSQSDEKEREAVKSSQQKLSQGIGRRRKKKRER